MKTLVLALGLMAVAQADGGKKTDGKTAPDLERVLKADAMEASVLVVTSSGDLILFDGAITVPARRPSVEECGEWMSLPPKERPAQLGEIRRKAEKEAFDRRMSPRERHLYTRKAQSSKRECQARFKKKCDEIRARIDVDTRKSAVTDARKVIGGLLAEQKVKAQIQGYLKNVLAACPLEQ